MINVLIQSLIVIIISRICSIHRRIRFLQSHCDFHHIADGCIVRIIPGLHLVSKSLSLNLAAKHDLRAQSVVIFNWYFEVWEEMDSHLLLVYLHESQRNELVLSLPHFEPLTITSIVHMQCNFYRENAYYSCINS